jgi:ethanolamine ammonia-lyase small subunit
VADSTPSRAAIPLSTSARLSLGSADPALSTHEHLRFQLDHALARDAVHTPLDLTPLAQGLRERNLSPLVLNSAATTRALYLRRPDLGRTLHPDSCAALQDAVRTTKGPKSGREESPVLRGGDDTSRILVILADGLSSLALEHHALPLLDAFPSSLSSHLFPLVPVITNARVALGDEVGSLLHADLTLLLIGERPGLSSPDSLGAYLTFAPQPGRTDAERNCISNIRTEGLSYGEAAHRIAYYIEQALKLYTTGIALKDPEKASQLDAGV